MTQPEKKASSQPYVVQQGVRLIGERIRIARVRRNMGQEELAQACGITRKTLYRMEKGDGSGNVATLLTVLWKLGMLDTLHDLANPDNDAHGKILEASRLPSRASSAKPPLDTDF